MRESRYRGLTSSVCCRQIGGACRYHHGRTDVDHHESLIQVENIGYWYSRYEHNILRLWRQIRIHPLKTQINLPDIPNSPTPLIALVELYYNTYSALFFFPKYLLVSPNGKSTSESFNSK